MTGRRVLRAVGSAARRLMLRQGDESGFSMIEIALAMTVMMIVLLVGMRAAGTVIDVETQAADKGQATTQVVTAVSELRQEIVSANVIFDPTGEIYTSGSNSGQNYAGKNADGTFVPAGWSLRIYTQLNGNNMCVEWRVLDTGALQTREWAPFADTAHPWSTLATNVVNSLPQYTSQPPFSLNHSANYGGVNSRLVVISLWASAGNARVVTTLFQTSIAARDAEYFPANPDNCSPVPAS